MTLAIPAFVGLPEDHLKREAIARFCLGCTDKDAARSKEVRSAQELQPGSEVQEKRLLV